MTRYLLDANVFIQAKNQHYGFDFCPAFWEWLVKENQSGKVASIDKVGDELGRAMTFWRIGHGRAATAFF